jgi:hypothetical protein
MILEIGHNLLDAIIFCMLGLAVMTVVKYRNPPE